jgi:microcompartment protein CcmL/EutN
MASEESLGFVETYGLVAAIEAADAMAKAARVRVKTVLNADLGLLSVVCEGDLAACRAAVDAGKAAAERIGKCTASNVIGRPDADTEVFIDAGIPSTLMPKPAPGATPTSPSKSGRKGRDKA